uniref:Box C/D snoRNA protein 1 n=1 Tax=Lates calcarifer TaxID=8187 RepID=A0A4W6FNP2_LATCA
MCSVILPKTDIMSAEESREEISGQEEEEQRGTKRKISLSNCGVCGSEEAKYRCPGCLTHSCSMLCVKKHKDDSGCSGVRDKTAFVRLSQFDEMALLSDYRFLEDTGRFADGTTRDSLIRAPRTTMKAKKLAASARKMNITLRLLPITFTKSKENSTFFHTKEKRFMWHLKLIFPQSSTEFSQRRVSDRQTLEQILTPYIHPTESDPVTRQKYHELDMQKSLRDNLSYKTLIEYPVLHIVLREHWKDYPLKGPAAPASARSSFATKSEGVNQEKEDVTQISPYCATGGTNIWTGTPETRSGVEPPQEKRAKKKSVEEEVEEGEILGSSEEDNEEEEGNAEEITPCDNSCGAAKHPARDMQVIKDELGDSVDINADDGVNKPSDSRRDRSINEDITGSTDDNSAAAESAEVSMIKDDAVK